MIIFYRDKECSKYDLVQKSLKEMHLAHKVVEVSAETDPAVLPPGTAAPLLVVDDEKIQGDNNIIEHLEVLERIKAEWDESMANACQCNDV
jgi:hypothetical protein